MPRNSPLVLILLLGSLVVPPSAYAQLTPPAGSAGAGNTPISGVPFGPANPRVLSDPSGMATRRASRRFVQTRRCRRSSTDPSVHRRHAR